MPAPKSGKSKGAKSSKPAQKATKTSRRQGADPFEMSQKTGLPASYFMKDLPKGGVY